MAGLANIFEVIGAHPFAKWIVAIFALRALWTMACWRRVAVAAPPSGESPERVEVRRQALWRHSHRFLLVMVAGIALAIAGLFRLASAGGDAPLSLLMLAVGIYLFQTEPVRQQIADAEDRATVAAARGDADGLALALAMLRGSHLTLVMIEVGAVVVLGLGILVLSGTVGALIG